MDIESNQTINEAHSEKLFLNMDIESDITELLTKPLKIIISGGGTGGHVYPAIAIANALKEVHDNTEILFVGAFGKMEMQKVPEAGYKIEGLWISGFQRRLTFKNLLFPIKLCISLMKAKNIINKFNPDIVVGVGGYSSGPIVYMAAKKGIPTLIQEQNSYPGIANKLLASKVQKVCVAYDGLEKYFHANKIIKTGNPVRQSILGKEITKEQARAHFGLDKEVRTVLVMGGSLGARTINQSIVEGLGSLSKEHVQVIWQTGNHYYEEAIAAVEKNNEASVKVLDFISEMEYAYRAADVIVSRAGAISISELCHVGKPVILIPSPNVAEDHQTKNAMSLVDHNAAMMVRDNEAKTILIRSILDLLKDEAKQSDLSKNITQMAVNDSANMIAKEIFDLIKKPK